MPVWAIITVAAAFLQNLRSMGQKHLRTVMGTTGATFARFGFGVPFAILCVLILNQGVGYTIPGPNVPFLGWVILGGVLQIAATFLLIHVFAYRNFMVGTAYSRTEPAQAAIFALIVLGETVTPLVLLAIVISVVGVMLISVAHSTGGWQSLIASLWSRAAVIGLASGAGFGVAAVSYRQASLALLDSNFIMQAAVTLLWTITFQTIIMLAWMLARDREELVRVARAWKLSLFVGLTGALASFGWFMAMTLEQASVVKALAQVEMIFTFATTVFFFRERINRLEIAGCTLIVAGILVLLAAH